MVNSSKGPWYRPRRSRRAQHIALAIVVVTVSWCAFKLHGVYEWVTSYDARPLSDRDDLVELDIPRGASFPEVLRELQRVGILDEDGARSFRIYVLHKGAAAKVRAGKHELRADMTPQELLDELMRAPMAESFKVTIPEGKSYPQIAEIIAMAGNKDQGELVAAMRDPALLSAFEIEGPNAEGYLFPDTYLFRADASADEIVRKMLERHRQVYDQLRRGHREAARRLQRELGWGHREIVIMASIVEKETGLADERPLIAGVFLNRLRFSKFQPKLLQTDPTIVYGCTVLEQKSPACQQFDGRIRRIHLEDRQNPYNTYTHEGLPPGPIANPGKAALEAVFSPTKSQFLYFVAKYDGTGGHQFSSNRADHERAVDRYIRNR